MLVGVPREIKSDENRVGLTPTSAREVIENGHQVIVETNAGAGVDFDDESYRAVGAEVVDTAAEVFERAEMIVKVKEPQPSETAMLRPDQILFTYLHLAPDPEQTDGLVKSRCVAIAYETVTSPRGGLPLLAPMSEVAGRMGVQAGARCLEKIMGGRGVLLGGVPGVGAGRITIIGGGVAGSNALQMAVGIGAEVTVLDKSVPRLAYLDELYGGRVRTLYSTSEAVEQSVVEADLVIGCVLVPGAAAPKLVTRDMVKRMNPGSVIVDIAVDQGGCCETTKATTHNKPTYIVDDVVHYCVANMPGAVARTSTIALNNATLPFVLKLVNQGVWPALAGDPHLLNGLNVCHGHITHEAVARDLGRDYTDPHTFVRDGKGPEKAVA
ncbi:MAG: alanine dehydrogenase [Halofilum sp. (in: g-proteobacteria)]|nr:alanine dehydrogenase [Halofilum sp. (in: g-proteobacteria)]